MASTNPGRHGLLCGTHNQVIDLLATSLLVDCYASSYGIDVEACSHSKPRCMAGWRVMARTVLNSPSAATASAQ